MTDPLSGLENMVATALATHPGPTEEDVRYWIGNLRSLPLFEVVTDEEAERLCKGIRRACEHHPASRLRPD